MAALLPAKSVEGFIGVAVMHTCPLQILLEGVAGEGVALEDIGTVLVGESNLGPHLLGSEDPVQIRHRGWHHAHQHGLALGAGLVVAQGDGVTEGDRGDAVDGVCKNARQVDAVVGRLFLTESAENVDVGVGHGVEIRPAGCRGGGFARVAAVVEVDDMRRALGGLDQADIIDGLINIHVLGVDIVRPVVADTLLLYEESTHHVLDGNGDFVERGGLHREVSLPYGEGMGDHKEHDHNDGHDVDEDDYFSVHSSLFSLFSVWQIA